jgi:hypothetical protein
MTAKTTLTQWIDRAAMTLFNGLVIVGFPMVLVGLVAR